jgi:hypothetical protein
MYRPYTEVQEQIPGEVSPRARDAIKAHWLRNGFNDLEADHLTAEEIGIRLAMIREGMTGQENVEFTVSRLGGLPSIVIAEVDQ